MTDVVIKRLSELDRAHTPLLNDMLHIMRGDKDYHILYGDYVDAILPGLGVDEPKWNAGKLHNVPVVITNPTDKEYIVYNSASNSFINKQILYSDINYGTLGVVNGLEYLKVVSGNLTSSRILTTELQPSNVNAAGKYLRVSADGMSVYEDALIQETTIATSDITNLNTSQSGIGQITSATLNRPSGSVGFAFVARQPNGNSAAMITVDTNNGATKVRTHNGGANQNSFTVYYDIYNSRTNPLSSEITSTSATSIANSLAVSTLNQKIETFIANSGNNSALLNTHKSSGDHDVRYYTKTYIDATFPNFTIVSNAAILTTGKLDNNRLNDTITSNTSGNAATATKLKTPISLNGSNFDGSGNITTEVWGTSRTLTVGSTSKSVNGGSNVGWTLAEIGVPSTTGAGASGDWGINITGNAATATYATNAGTAATVNYANSAGYATSAGSATKLETARTIGGVSFDGSENIDLPGVNTTGNQNTSGNAATATYATSAGSATSAGTATYATSAGTATSATNATVSLENRASISGETSTGSVTNAHLHQVNASSMSTSSYYNSQVNASSSCNATARTSQVNASSSCNATGVMSQANASLRSNASHTLSQVNVSSDSISSGYSSQVNASSYGRATGTKSQVNASEMSTASGTYSQINASTRVENSTDSSTAWGHAESGSRSTANQKIRLDSKTGVGRFKGSTTTGGFDYAEYFPHLNNGVIPDGTIVTLVNEKITPAQAGDFILGTVSATAGVIGNAPEFCWSGRFLKDEFGRELKQEADFVRWQSDSDFYDGLVSECDKPIPSDATYYKQYIPVENPDYVDISGDYKPRGDRKDEWSIIGLMGQVYVRVYEDIEHNTYVGADGKHSEDVTRLYCMKMATPYSTEKGYGVAFCLLR